jgi:RNA recognition motif-containing protein
MSIRLYVGNLPKNDVERDELQVVFAEAGDLVSVKVIKDRKTGKCRGFGFVTVETDEQADQIIEKYNGAMFQEMPIKIEKALPKAKGDDEDGEGGESTPREPRDIPKPTLSANKVAATPTASNNPAPTPRRSGGNSGTGGNSGGGNSGGGKKGARKESNKSNNGGAATYTSTPSTDFQPDPRWAGKLAELKDKLAQSGNP